MLDLRRSAGSGEGIARDAATRRSARAALSSRASLTTCGNAHPTFAVGDGEDVPVWRRPSAAVPPPLSVSVKFITTGKTCL